MARIFKGFHSFTCTPHSSANGMNHTCLYLPSHAGTHLPTPEEWKTELILGGWLVTSRNKRRAPVASEVAATPKGCALAVK